LNVTYECLISVLVYTPGIFDGS